MNWYSIGLAAFSGALAALIGMLVFGKEPADKSAHRTVVVILFILFTALSKIFILPKIDAYRAKAAVNAALEDVPAFASMKKYAPEVHRSISKTMLDAIDRGMPAQQASLLVRGQVQNFVSTRLPNASDTALVAYVGVMTEEMGALQAAGNGMCFQFMFPASAGGVDVSKSISKETQNKDLAALDEIVKSSNTHRAPPQQNEVMPYMQPIFIALRDKYGDGITVLEHPEAPGVDREKVCNMTRDLYTKILALPTGQAGAGLRWMFSQK